MLKLEIDRDQVSGQAVDDVGVVAYDRLGGFEVKPSGENRQPAAEVALALVEQVERPRHRLAQGLLVAAAGCATGGGGMRAGDCAGADWYAIGLEDGRNGHAGPTLEQRRQTCAGAGVELDTARYDAGRQEGYKAFCTQSNGFQFGKAAGEYKYVCKGKTEMAFVDAYQLGLQVRELKDNVRDVERNMNNVEREMRRLQSQLSQYERQLYNTNTGDATRRAIMNDIDRLRRDIYQLQEDRAHYQHQFNVADSELKNFEERLPGYALDEGEEEGS